jgi:hypothetical protein
VELDDEEEELEDEEELLELKEVKTLDEEALLFDEKTELLEFKLGTPAQLTTSKDKKVVVNNCLFMKIPPLVVSIELIYLNFSHKTTSFFI